MRKGIFSLGLALVLASLAVAADEQLGMAQHQVQHAQPAPVDVAPRITVAKLDQVAIADTLQPMKLGTSGLVRSAMPSTWLSETQAVYRPEPGSAGRHHWRP